MVWLDSGGLSAQGDSMRMLIHSADRWGLFPNDYHLKEIDELLAQRQRKPDPSLDVLLTDSFFGIYFHLKYGRVEPKTFNRLILSRLNKLQTVSALNDALHQHGLVRKLKGQEPSFREYAALRDTLQKLIDRKPRDTVSLKHIDQLVSNLERWRWQKKFPDRYISVNAPSFKLRLVENDTVRVESRVIVGKFETQTPELESIIKSFIIYPYWHVPRSILKEILPLAQQDTFYLKRHNYDVLDRKGKTVKISSIDWGKYTDEDFPYVLRQRDGYENTMGVIKFVFNNKYGVYLHDTNAKGLFRKNDRAFSHGCIRVQKAADVARYLVKDDDVVAPEDLDQYLQLQRRMEISLPKPIPVLLQYFTCEEDGGRIIFYHDIYQKDKALISALTGSKPSIDSVLSQKLITVAR